MRHLLAPHFSHISTRLYQQITRTATKEAYVRAWNAGNQLSLWPLLVPLWHFVAAGYYGGSGKVEFEILLGSRGSALYHIYRDRYVLNIIYINHP